MCNVTSEIKDIETIAHAIEQIPGFKSMMWSCARYLYEAQQAAQELREYKASHSTLDGKAYIRLVKKDAQRAEAYCTCSNMLTTILEAANPFYDHMGLMFEVDQLKNRYAEQMGAIRR